jgi:periplasmic protein TonB
MASSAKINVRDPRKPPSSAEEPKPKTAPQEEPSPHPAFAYHASQQQARQSSRVRIELSWLVAAGITIAVALIVILFVWNLTLSDRIATQERTTVDLRLKNQKLSDQLDSILLVSQLNSTTDSLGSRVGTAQQEFEARAGELRQRPIPAGNARSSLPAPNPYDLASRPYVQPRSTALPAPASSPGQYRRSSPPALQNYPTANPAPPQPVAQQAPQQGPQLVSQQVSQQVQQVPQQASPATAYVAPRAVSQRSETPSQRPETPKPVDVASLRSSSPSIPTGIPARSSPMTVVPAPPKKLVISSGVMNGYRLSGAKPEYPAMAKSLHLQGSVVLAASISKAGIIENLRAISGPLMLQSAALNAVRTWRYKPYLLNGQPVPVDTTVIVAFGPGY